MIYLFCLLLVLVPSSPAIGVILYCKFEETINQRKRQS